MRALVGFWDGSTSTDTGLGGGGWVLFGELPAALGRWTKVAYGSRTLEGPVTAVRAELVACLELVRAVGSLLWHGDVLWGKDGWVRSEAH